MLFVGKHCSVLSTTERLKKISRLLSAAACEALKEKAKKKKKVGSINYIPAEGNTASGKLTHPLGNVFYPSHPLKLTDSPRDKSDPLRCDRICCLVSCMLYIDI